MTKGDSWKRSSRRRLEETLGELPPEALNAIKEIWDMSDASKVEPALTAEAWAEFFEYIADPSRCSDDPSHVNTKQERGELWWHQIDDRCYEDEETGEADYHGIAALTLYGKSYGFTHADVALLREHVAMYNGGDNEEDDTEAARFSSLADRLAALLPPDGVSL